VGSWISLLFTNFVKIIQMEKELNPEDIYETCVMCGALTTVLKTTHIDHRVGYIEGAGQVCPTCWSEI
jgi:hypothetical protein